jgi:hypothetical protein
MCLGNFLNFETYVSNPGFHNINADFQDFDPSILRHSGIWGAADEAVLNKVRKISKKDFA